MTVLHIPSCALFSCTEKCHEEIWGTFLWKGKEPSNEGNYFPLLKHPIYPLCIYFCTFKAPHQSRKGLMAPRYLQKLIPRRDTDVLYLRKSSLYHAQLHLCTSVTIHYSQVCPQNLEENTTSCLNQSPLCCSAKRLIKTELENNFSFPPGFTQIFQTM